MGRGSNPRDLLLGKSRFGESLKKDRKAGSTNPELESVQKDSPLSDPVEDRQRLSKKFRPQIIDIVRDNPDTNWYPKNLSNTIAEISRQTETRIYTGQTFWTIVMAMIDEGELVADKEFNISLP